MKFYLMKFDFMKFHILVHTFRRCNRIILDFPCLTLLGEEICRQAQEQCTEQEA